MWARRNIRIPYGQSGGELVSPTGDASIRKKLQGLLGFRLLLGIFFLILTILVQSRRQESLLSGHLQPLYFFSCILFLFTIVAALSLKHVRNLVAYGYFQLFFDVEAVTVLIYLSGGIDSPFSFLYMPVIISAALLLYRRGSLLTASMCGLSYGLLMDLQYFGWLSPLRIVTETATSRDSGSFFHSILMNVAGFYLVGYLSGYLAEELQKSSQQVREQKRDLHQLEVLQRNIVQSMNSGLLTISQTGYVQFFNHAAQDILGLLPDRIQGRPIQSIFPTLNPMTWSERARSATSTASPSSATGRTELSYRRPAGEVLCLGYTTSVLQKADRENQGWILIFQDLTHLKQMEEHVQRMERLAFAGRIAAEIAHEIKNPLASISGAVQMLQIERSQDPIHSRLMDIINREIRRINELVADFLWLAKGWRRSEQVEEIPICGIIQEVIALLKVRERIGPCHQVRTIFESTPVFSMDPQHFRQILWNLLLNALEAMPLGGDLIVGVKNVKAKGGKQGEILIEVRDTGGGVAEEIRGRLFEPFFTTKESGTGLGLSIVYQLVENAGGRIEIEHYERCGTCFSIFFPLS